jgi:large subunit ribosomal protein L18
MSPKGQNPRAAARQRRHLRIRRKVRGTPERPRLAVSRSLKHVAGQIIDDSRGVTLVGLSSADPELRGASPEPREDASGTPPATKTARARAAGRLLAERARERGIQRVVFDRGGYVYHGRIKAFAEGAREGGLDF